MSSGGTRPYPAARAAGAFESTGNVGTGTPDPARQGPLALGRRHQMRSKGIVGPPSSSGRSGKPRPRMCLEVRETAGGGQPCLPPGAHKSGEVLRGGSRGTAFVPVGDRYGGYHMLAPPYLRHERRTHLSAAHVLGHTMSQASGYRTLPQQAQQSGRPGSAEHCPIAGPTYLTRLLLTVA